VSRSDTPVWSLALRRSQRDLNPAEKSVVAALAELIDEGRARMMGLVRQELLSGMRTRRQFTKLQEMLRAFPDELVTTPDYDLAAAIGDRCRSRGLAVSVSDVLICAVAQPQSWAIFFDRPRFNRYGAVIARSEIRPKVPGRSNPSRWRRFVRGG
jgi:predicted nucleic acid-binding protein